MVAKICKTLSTIILVILLILAILLIGPPIAGMKTYAVLSGSMEPAIHVGGIVYVKPTEPENINEQDIITFTLPGNDVMATHRVLETHADTQEFITKGDANDTDDGPIAYDRLVGKVVLVLPYLGYLISMIQSKEGILVGTGLLIILILLAFLPEIFKRLPAEADTPFPDNK